MRQNAKQRRQERRGEGGRKEAVAQEALKQAQSKTVDVIGVLKATPTVLVGQPAERSIYRPS